MQMLDATDRSLIDALSRDGRVPFNRVADVLGVSPQTVARRYRRLQAQASLRVVGQVRPAFVGRVQWLLRVSAIPRVSADIAAALSKRPDTSRVNITSGGDEIVCLVDTDGATTSYPLFLRDLPKTDGITGVVAHRILHTYFGGPRVWSGQTSELSSSQRDSLAENDVQGRGTILRRGLDDIDRKMLDVLTRDGRASLRILATYTGCSTVTIARRLADLQSMGALYFDVDIDPGTLGASTRTLLWLSAPPAKVDEIARTLATHEELAFVATSTGRSNLVATALCRDAEGLHRYLTKKLGQVAHIAALESSPVMRNLKGAGAIEVERRLPPKSRPRGRLGAA